MQYTLLDIVQSYLTATDGFNVGSIDDTIESQQVSQIAQDVFFEVIAEVQDWKFTRKLIQLDSYADPDFPNYMLIPANVVDIRDSRIQYNIGGTDGSIVRWNPVCYLSPQRFLDRIVNPRGETLPRSQRIVDPSGVDLIIMNEKAPEWYTTFDDVTIVFDSWDSTKETTLQSSNTQVLANVERTFTLDDDYVIDLPRWFHPHFNNLVKARAAEYLRGEPLVSDARMGRIGLMKAKQRIGRAGGKEREPVLDTYGRQSGYGRGKR